MAERVYGKSRVSYDTWAATTAYSLTDRVVPTVPDGQCYECTTAGTSGETEPTWDKVPEHTTNDGTVVWTCKDIPGGSNPLTVTLDVAGRGGLSLMELWVKSNVECEFRMYGSHDGTDGTWRLIEEIAIPTKQGKYEKHDGYFNAYHHVKVLTEESGEHEIEIVAGES